MALRTNGKLLRDRSSLVAKRLTSTCPSLPIRSRLERSCKARGTFGEQPTGRDLLLAVPSLQRRVRIQPVATSPHWAERPALTIRAISQPRPMGLTGAPLPADALSP